MSQKIAEAYVEISARMDKMEADLKTAQGKFAAATGKMQQSAGGLTASMDKVRLAYAAAATFIGGAFVSAIAGAIKSTADHLDQLDEMSVKTGVSVEMLTSLELAAKQNSVSMEKLATSIRMMYRSMYEANGGSKEAADAYKRLGVEIKDAQGNLKSGNDAFLEVADAISKIKNPAEKSALAMKVFGRAGAEMIPMLQGGRKALEAYIEKAKSMGLVFTNEDAKRAAAFADQLDQLGSRMRAFKEKSLLPVLDALTQFMMFLSGEKSENVSMATLTFSDMAKYTGTLVKNLVSGKSYIEAAATAAVELRQNTEAAAVAAGKYNDYIYGKYLRQPTYSSDITAKKYTPISPLARFVSAERPESSKQLFDVSGALRMKEPMSELIGMFPELQATIIDTSVTLQDQLVAPFGEMMTELQGQWSGTISEFIKGGQSFGDFMGNMFEDVLDAFSRMLGQMLSQWLTNQLFGSITGFSLGGGLKAGPEVASTFNARTGTSVVINAVDAQSFDDALRRNAASVTNIVYESQHYGRAS